MNQTEIQSLLVSLRQYALAKAPEALGGHQLDAHWSLAYACGQPPTAWELYRSVGLTGMPATTFFETHRGEIEGALQPKARWDLLRDYAVPKLALADSMSERECRAYGYPGNVQFIDPVAQAWTTVDIPAVQWFDSRDALRASLLESKEDLQAKIEKNLTRYQDAAARDPSPKRLETLRGYKKFIHDILPENLQQFDTQKLQTRRWLSKLDRTPDFGKRVFALVREAENEVRAAHGIAAVGEAWVTETELLYRVRELLPEIEVIPHGQPKWLGRQHFDIWIPSISVALEYHGIQHFRPVEFFGGEDAFQHSQERDERKRRLCAANSVRLIEVAYDSALDDAVIVTLLRGGTYGTLCSRDT